MNSSDAGSEASLHPRSRRKPRDLLNSFFTSKASHINDYYIDLDEPHKQFGPGDTVSGRVVLDVSRPLGITHVSLSLFGYVEVFKSHSTNKSRTRTNASRTATGRGKRWVSEYYGDGFASLFEDELVLCGDGRLDPKLYHFRFEIDFPSSLNLPSSIDFERGTISYAVSSTITRPTNLASTTSRDRQLVYRERIDVGSLSTPKPRKVTLEPVNRGNKRTSGLKRLASSSNQEQDSLSSQASTQASAIPKAEQSSRLVPSDRTNHHSRPSSPISPSAASSASVPSAKDSAISSKACSSPTSPSTKVDDASASSQTITCNVQLGRAGCLPGEVLPLVVSINHTKPIRSLNGVIATLYRQARTDMHPFLPIHAKGKGERYEDYYPRSKSGLGGMSLSAAGSSQVWRKDLSQTLAPLYIDPRTMSSEVKVAVRVPEEAFPSIRNAPGEMISFKYYVEIIIDVHGKLATYASKFPNVNVTGGQSALANGTAVGFSSDSREHNVTVWGSNCIDTTSIQREKNAVVITNQLLIGTSDSAKARGKRKQATLHEPVTGGAQEDDGGFAQEHNGYNSRSRNYFEPNGSYDGFHEDYESYDQNYDYMNDQGNGHGHYYNANGYEPTHYDYFNRDITTPVPNAPVHLPHTAADEHLTEKQRIKRAEEALLPSQPPDLEVGETTSSDAAQMPSAPHLPSEGDFDSPQAYTDVVRGFNGYNSGHPCGINASTLATEPDPPVPAYSPHRASRGNEHLEGAEARTPPNMTHNASAHLSDDKQEMERSRLQGLTSAPDDRSKSVASETLHQCHDNMPNGPSAPLIDEVDGISMGAEPGASYASGCNGSPMSKCGAGANDYGDNIHHVNNDTVDSGNALGISHEGNNDTSRCSPRR